MSGQEKRFQEMASDLLRDLWRDAQAVIGRTERQVGEFFAHLAARGSISPEESRRVAGEVLRRLQKNRQEVTRYLDRRLEGMAKVMSIPTRSEVEELKERVERLSQRLDRLSAQHQ